jgi:hypothetical protein
MAPGEEQGRALLALARDRRFQAAVSGLVDTPAEWDRALADPAGWLRARDSEVPQQVAARWTKALTISKPPGPEIAAKPGPDWIPFAIRQVNCRTFWVPEKDDDGKIVGYEEVTVCLGLELVPSPVPGGAIG